MIAIIKGIEMNQTKPTTAMLLAPFEEGLTQEEPILVERKFSEGKIENELVEDITVPKIRYERLEDNMKSVKKDFIYVLDKVKVVKSSFGKDYLKLELTEGELVKFRRTLRRI